MNELVRILRLPAVLEVTGLSRSALYEKVAAGTFPQPVQLTKVAVGWFAHEVDDWARSLPRVGVSAGVSEQSDAA